MTNIPILSNKRIHFISILLSVLFFNSCVTHQLLDAGYNAKTEGQLLAISEKKEIKASASVAFINKTTPPNDYSFYPEPGFVQKRTKVSLLAGYGFHKHFAVQGNFMYFNSRDSRKQNNYFIQTFSIGHFHKNSYVRVRRGKTLNKSIMLDAYLGLGYGETRHNYHGDPLASGRLKINFMRGFVHGGFHYDSGRLVKIGLAAKILYTDYLILNKISDIPQSEEQTLNDLINRDPFFNFEFSPRLGVGNDYFNVYVTNTINFRGLIILNSEVILNTFIGTEFNFTQWSKKRKAKKQNKELLID